MDVFETLESVINAFRAYCIIEKLREMDGLGLLTEETTEILDKCGDWRDI